MKLIKKNKNYGCFSVTVKCKICDKIILVKNYSLMSDNISITDDKTIMNKLSDSLKEQEINYCCKCGIAINTDSLT